MEIIDLRAARFKFLHKLYQSTGGDEKKRFKESKIGEDLGFDKITTDLIGQYLLKEGLIEQHAFGPIIGITHAGIKDLEYAITNPGKPTRHFPPVVNMIDAEDAAGPGSRAGGSGPEKEAFDIKSSGGYGAFIKILKDKLAELQFPQNDNSVLKSDIATIEAQLFSDRPKTGIIKECLLSIKDILESATSGLIAEELLKYLPALLELIPG